MAAIFTQAIPVQRFEAIRDKIADVLAVEFAEQFVITGNAAYNPKKVWKERQTFHAIDKTEVPCINVTYQGGNIDLKAPNGSTFINLYYVVVYTAAKSTNVIDGDALAAINNQRISGMVRAILDNPNYRQLRDPSLKIQKSRIKSIQPQGVTALNSVNVYVTVIEFEVTAGETFEFIVPQTINSMGTTVKLYDTDDGYYYGTTPPYYTIYAENNYAFITEDGNYIITEN